MSNNLNTALNQASYDEFSWLDTFDNPYKNHKFSDEFERKILDICQPPECDYIGVSNPRFRKKLILILVAMFALIISGCAIAHYYIVWNEAQNDDYGTLDVEFEIDDDLPNVQVDFIFPKISPEYEDIEKIQNPRTLMLEYKNSNGEIISYSQQIGLDGVGSVSINNETDVFEEITINGYKGYHSENAGVNFYIWSDGYCLYTLQGTCSNETLLEIIESIKLTEQ